MVDGSKHRVEFVPAYDFEFKMEYYDDPYLLGDDVVPRLGFDSTNLSLKTKLKEFTVITDQSKIKSSIPLAD